MKYFIYDFFLHIIIVLLFPYFIIKAMTKGKYRAGVRERFGFISPEKLKGLSGGPVVWVHAVSVGEARAAMPLLKLVKDRHPKVRVVFSTVTQTGNMTAAADGAPLIDALIYFPLDLSWAVKRVVRRLSPRAFIVVEKETWPNLFLTLNKNAVPIVVVNGTLSERSARRFKRLSFFFKDIFGLVSFYCARTDQDMAKAVSAGVAPERAKVTGNIKFDLKPPLVDSGYLVSLKNALGIKGSEPLFVAGSTHPGEEEIVLKAYGSAKSKFPDLKLVLAPRHPERFGEVESIIKKTGFRFSRRSEGLGGDVVLLDTMGELSLIYSFSTIALVGGSLVPGIGGHNLLEPAFFGKPVLYGSHLTTYLNMAEMLEAAHGGVRVADGGLADELLRLLSDEGLREKTGQGAKSVVESNRGAAKRTMDVIEKVLPGNTGKRGSTVVNLRK